MEIRCLTMPHFAETMFDSLNNQELGDCNLVCKKWHLFLSNKKFVLLRKIQNTIETRHSFNEQWQLVLKKLNTEELIKLDFETKTFYSANGNFGINKLECLTTPLHWAVWTMNLEIVQIIIAKMDKENLNRTADGLTPLHIAALVGNLAIWNEIAMYEPDKNLETKYNQTIFELATVHDKPQICQMVLIWKGYEILQNDGFGIKQLHCAACFGCLNTYKLIAGHFTDINPTIPTDPSLETPLHIAAECGHLDLCIWIMDNLDDKSPMDSDGTTPLHLAAKGGQLKIILKIMSKITETNPLNNEGNSPLHFAAENGHSGVYEKIMKDFPANPANNAGLTPLHVAAQSGNWQLYHVIEDKLVEKNPKDNSGITPKKMWKNSARNQQVGHCTIL